MADFYTRPAPCCPGDLDALPDCDDPQTLAAVDAGAQAAYQQLGFHTELVAQNLRAEAEMRNNVVRDRDGSPCYFAPLRPDPGELRRLELAEAAEEAEKGRRKRLAAVEEELAAARVRVAMLEGLLARKERAAA